MFVKMNIISAVMLSIYVKAKFMIWI